MADVTVQEGKIKLGKSPKTVKKRARNPEEWHKQKQKRLRIAGQEHVNTNGKLIPAKRPGPDCCCRRKCFQKVPEQVRLKTFEGFYALKSHDAQNAYLFGLMRQVDIKRKRKKDSFRRTCTFEYFVRVRGRETQVCQTAFKNIHSISERKVRVLCKKMDEGVMYPCDNRGRNSTCRAGEVRIPSHIIDQIKEHIFSIVHTNKLRDYMRMDKVNGLVVNISKMWKDYIAMYDPDYAGLVACKNKKNTLQQHQLHDQNTAIIQNAYAQEMPGTSAGDTFHSLSYPGSGHLINIAESYFAQAVVSQTQYPTQHLSVGNYIHADKLGYYQQGQLIVQPSGVQQVIRADTITPLGASLGDSNTFVIVQSLPQTSQEQDVSDDSFKEQDKVKKEGKEKKKGPAVKQWRYSAIFHEEINGATWAAIKTRMASYLTESEEGIKKKKVDKQIHQQTIIQQTIQPQTVTIGTTPVHIRHVNVIN